MGCDVRNGCPRNLRSLRNRLRRRSKRRLLHSSHDAFVFRCALLRGDLCTRWFLLRNRVGRHLRAGSTNLVRRLRRRMRNPAGWKLLQRTYHPRLRRRSVLPFDLPRRSRVLHRGLGHRLCANGIACLRSLRPWLRRGLERKLLRCQHNAVMFKHCLLQYSLRTRSFLLRVAVGRILCRARNRTVHGVCERVRRAYCRRLLHIARNPFVLELLVLHHDLRR